MFDEYAMLSTSMNMHLTRRWAVVSTGLYENGQMQYTGDYIEKPPLGFPLLVSSVHDLSGYRPANVFVVNAVVGFAFLGTVYLIGVLLGGSGLGLLGVLLAAGLPLVAQTATGAGLDLLGATLVLAVLAQESPAPALAHVGEHGTARGRLRVRGAGSLRIGRARVHCRRGGPARLVAFPADGGVLAAGPCRRPCC